MSVSRRTLLRRVGAGAAATLAAPSLAEALIVDPVPPDARPTSSRPIRLHRNENAYGPSPGVLAAMAHAAASANRYAGVESDALARAIAGVHGVRPEQVVLGCGAGEILRMAAAAFLGSGKKLIVALPTYDVISRHAQVLGAEVVAIPLTAEHSHNLDVMLARCDAATGLIYICNPNNPTGTLTLRRDLDAFLRHMPATTHVLIDEAYHHYVGRSSDYASFVDRPVEDRRVIVARTFSKIYGMAGLRLGYAVAAPETSRLLAEHQLSDSVNLVVARAALAALEDVEHVRASANRNLDDRQEFLNQANARMLRAIDSQANFVMLNVLRPAVEVVAHFEKHDILLAPPFPAFDMHVRVSLGTPAEMREFWRVWDLLPGHKMHM